MIAPPILHRRFLPVVLLVLWLLLGVILFSEDWEKKSTPIPFTSLIPVRLQIPAIGIDAPVVPVSLDVHNAMNVPPDAATVGWYALGTLPSATGSAVFSGHLDTVLGTRGVFWNLHLVQPGDVLLITTKSGATLRFIVQSQHIYPYNKAPIQKIFADPSGRFLNLITCNGIWNRTTYDKRLVIESVFDSSDKEKKTTFTVDREKQAL